MKFFSIDSDLRQAKRVTDFIHMKILRFNLLILGGRPKHKDTSTFKNGFAWHIVIVNVFCIVTQIIYLRNNSGKMSSLKLGHSYVTLFMATVVTSRVILVFTDKYHKIAINFTESMHLMNHKNKSEYAEKTHILVHKISHVFTMYLYIMMALSVLMFNLMPCYINYRKGMFGPNIPENRTFELSVYHALPFNYSTDLRGYLVMFIYNFYSTSMVAISFCSHDLHLSLMVFHLWGHIRILINFLDNFPKPGGGGGKVVGLDGSKVTADVVKYSDEELKEVFSKLCEAITHHNLILDFASIMSNTFGGILFYYLTFHQISGCFLLLECLQGNIELLLQYGVMTFELFQLLIQISIIFELLGTWGEKLEVAIYALPWECMDTKNRKIVLFMLCRSQESLNVKALGMIKIGVQTMVAIMKTSISYFMMLKTFANTD